MKSIVAKERDKFLMSERGKKLCAGLASGQALENRITDAFLAGVDIGKHLQPEDSADVILNGTFECPGCGFKEKHLASCKYRC